MNFTEWLNLRENIEDIKNLIISSIPRDVFAAAKGNDDALMQLSTKSLPTSWLHGILDRGEVKSSLEPAVVEQIKKEAKHGPGITIQQLINYISGSSPEDTTPYQKPLF